MESESVDLMCAETPFNTGKAHNVGFGLRTSLASEYEDTFHEMGDYSHDKSVSLNRVPHSHE